MGRFTNPDYFDTSDEDSRLFGNNQNGNTSEVLKEATNEVVQNDEKRTEMVSKLTNEESPEWLQHIDSAEALSEDELAEYVGKWRELIMKPKDGSFLHFVKKPSIGKKEVEEFFLRRYWKNLAFCFFDPKYSIPTFAIYSLVLPHPSANALAEEVSVLAQKHNKSEFDILSTLLGIKVKDRSDIANVLRSALRTHPKISDMVISMVMPSGK